MQYPPFVLFTDLDGTMLDHHTYQAKQSAAVLESLQKAGVPLIFCSSKTFDEQRFYQKKLGIYAPLVVENGSAVYIPDHFLPGHFNLLPKTVGGYFYQTFAHVDIVIVRSILSEISFKYHVPIAGYANSDENTLIKATGLKPMALKRARNRHFTETLHIPSLTDTEAAQWLSDQLKPYDLMLVKGGRFWSVQSKFAGKGHALRWMKSMLQDYFNHKIPVYAIGDSANDLPMLQAADRAFLVKKNNGSWEDTNLAGIERLNERGPVGFKNAVTKLLQENQLILPELEKSV